MLFHLINVILLLGGGVKAIDFANARKKTFLLDMKSQLLCCQEKALMAPAHLVRALSNEPPSTDL